MMTQKIKEQILAVRDTGEANMFDVNAVQYIADREGYRRCSSTYEKMPTVLIM